MTARISRWAVLGLAAALCGCASSRVEADGDEPIALASYDTFAFDTGPIVIEADGEPVEDEALLTEARRMVANELADLGLTQVAEDEARLLIGTRLTFVESRRNFDPLFSPYVAIKFETGYLWIEAFDTETKETVWRGQSHKRLRTSQQARGINRVQFEPTDEARHWCFDDLAEAIFSDRMPD